MTITDTTNIGPLTHDDAMELQAQEFERTLELLRSLDEADWTAQTECPDWNVRRMYLHVLGGAHQVVHRRRSRPGGRHNRSESRLREPDGVGPG